MDHHLHRIAINQSVILGSLYNASTDCAFGNLSFDKSLIMKIEWEKPVDCTIMRNYDRFDLEYLYGRIGIDKETWLNLALNIVSAQGTSSIVNYSFPKTPNIRFLYYYYPDREEWIHGIQETVIKNVCRDIPDTTATHIISDITSGIQSLVILELTSIDKTNFDNFLGQISEQLIMNKFEFTETQIRLLNQIKLIKIFSNIPDLVKAETLVDFCQKIIEIKSHTHRHLPLKYDFRPIKWFYPSYPKEKAKYIRLEQKTIEKIKQYLLSLSSTIEESKLSYDSKLESSLKEYINPYFLEGRKLKKIQEVYPDEIERIRDLVLNIRNGSLQQDKIDHFLTDEYRKSLQKHTNVALNNILSSCEREEPINTFKQESANNLKSGEVYILKPDNRTIVLQNLMENTNHSVDLRVNNDERKLTSSTYNHMDGGKTLMIIPSDHAEENSKPLKSPTPSIISSKQRSDNIEQTLNQRKSLILPMNNDTFLSEKHLPYAQTSRNVIPKFAEQMQEHSNNFDNQLNSLFTKQVNDIREENNIPTIKPVSQTVQQSKNIEESFNSSKISSSVDTSLSSKQSNNVNGQMKILESSKELGLEDTLSTKKDQADSEHSLNIDYTNILLLGESGVGKSTFINALVNYLQFKTFEKAHTEKPLVVIPVSFIMTIDDNFQEKIIKYGDLDSNENHNNLGQSVTQYCKSYLFKINNKTILRIIDTPGMGDTRGLDQDDLNIKNILSFINNLSHLNAICILLKPNESRLNIVLRSYFTRLIDFIGPNAQNNTIFCFTNTRSTFFTPGNTGPLLKQMINKLPNKDIPFNKSNTFCFDSESFRYLIARKNEIDFDEYLRQEYENSWIKSVKESNRFLDFILNEMKPYYQSEWISIEHAQFKINQIIRPLLETIRNILRNIILLKQNSSKYMIKLYPVDFSQASSICYKCKRTPERYSDFWILPDNLHSFSDKCRKCDCPQQKHIQVDYELKYELSQYEGTPSFKHMGSTLKQLQEMILKFGEFYGYVVDILQQNDPMLAALNRMIAEENQICREKGSECLNTKLYEMLAGIKNEYEKRQKISMSSKKFIDLPNIYEEIEKLKEIDEINKQMHVIKQAQEKYMKQNEKQVL